MNCRRKVNDFPELKDNSNKEFVREAQGKVRHRNPNYFIHCIFRFPRRANELAFGDKTQGTNTNNNITVKYAYPYILAKKRNTSLSFCVVKCDPTVHGQDFRRIAKGAFYSKHQYVTPPAESRRLRRSSRLPPKLSPVLLPHNYCFCCAAAHGMSRARPSMWWSNKHSSKVKQLSNPDIARREEVMVTRRQQPQKCPDLDEGDGANSFK